MSSCPVGSSFSSSTKQPSCLISKSEAATTEILETYKRIADRTDTLENYMKRMFEAFGQCIHDKASLRNSNDELAKIFSDYGSADSSPTTANFAMTMTSNTLFARGDSMDGEITLLEDKILPIIADFGSACKSMKDDVRSAKVKEDSHSQIRRELKTLQSEKRTMKNFEEQEMELEARLEKTLFDSVSQCRKIMKKFTKLEIRKCEDLRRILKKWCYNLLQCAAKQLELSTQGCQMAHHIDSLGDVQNLTKVLDLEDANFLMKIGVEDPEQIPNTSRCEAEERASSVSSKPVQMSSIFDKYPDTIGQEQHRRSKKHNSRRSSTTVSSTRLTSAEGWIFSPRCYHSHTTSK